MRRTLLLAATVAVVAVPAAFAKAAAVNSGLRKYPSKSAGPDM